jgi:hypothetical protein
MLRSRAGVFFILKAAQARGSKSQITLTVGVVERACNDSEDEYGSGTVGAFCTRMGARSAGDQSKEKGRLISSRGSSRLDRWGGGRLESEGLALFLVN